MALVAEHVAGGASGRLDVSVLHWGPAQSAQSQHPLTSVNFSFMVSLVWSASSTAHTASEIGHATTAVLSEYQVALGADGNSGTYCVTVINAFHDTCASRVRLYVKL
jgi:hypothetical protein